MTTTKKTTTGKGEAKKLKLKKETIQDLDLKNKARDVKGGLGIKLTWNCVGQRTAAAANSHCPCMTDACGIDGTPPYADDFILPK